MAGAALFGSLDRSVLPSRRDCCPVLANTLKSCFSFRTAVGVNLLRRTLEMTSGLTEKPSANLCSVHSSGDSCFKYLGKEIYDWSVFGGQITTIFILLLLCYYIQKCVGYEIVKLLKVSLKAFAKKNHIKII